MKKEYRDFLDERYPDFLEAKAKRRTSRHKNAKGWVRTTLIKEFVEEFFGDEDSDGGKEVSELMKEESLSFSVASLISDLSIGLIC